MGVGGSVPRRRGWRRLRPCPSQASTPTWAPVPSVPVTPTWLAVGCQSACLCVCKRVCMHAHECVPVCTGEHTVRVHVVSVRVRECV